MSDLARIVVGLDDAPALVLLHGITSSALSQADAIGHWAARGYRVVAVDARGHGISPRWTLCSCFCSETGADRRKKKPRAWQARGFWPDTGGR